MAFKPPLGNYLKVKFRLFFYSVFWTNLFICRINEWPHWKLELQKYRYTWTLLGRSRPSCLMSRCKFFTKSFGHPIYTENITNALLIWIIWNYFLFQFIHRLLENLYHNVNISQTRVAYIHWFYIQMYIYVHSNVQKQRESGREKREIFLCQASTGWDRKMVSDLIEFMNYLYPSILSGLK